MRTLILYAAAWACLLGACTRTASGPAWTSAGSVALENFGDKVAPAGDVNGDGYADAAVWASGYGEYRGRVLVYAGSSKGLSAQPVWSGQGREADDQFGHSFGMAGDVNGDGYGDFLAADQGQARGLSAAGQAYLYLGSAQGLAKEPAWSLAGPRRGALLGDCSAYAGDVNGDGLADVVIGAYGVEGYRGQAFVHTGSRQDFLSAKPAWTGQGEASGDWYAYSVFRAGDLNGDGRSDLVIGAKYASVPGQGRAGKAYAYYGTPQGLSAKASWRGQGEAEGSQFGWRAIGVGDLNGDGYGDLAVGAPKHGQDSGPGRAQAGKVYLYLGSAQGLAPAPAFAAGGEDVGAHLGHALAAGDFDGDGKLELAASAPGQAKGQGRVYLFDKGLKVRRIIDGEFEGDYFGQGLANAGDVNGDGVDDLMVGAPSHAGAGRRSGKAYLYLGSRP